MIYIYIQAAKNAVIFISKLPKRNSNKKKTKPIPKKEWMSNDGLILRKEAGLQTC